MKNKIFQDLIVFLRKPLVIIGVIIIHGLAVNAWLFASLIPEQQQRTQSLSTEISNLAFEKSQLERTEIPRKISPAELEAMLAKVPVKEDFPIFLDKLRNFIQQSGVTLQVLGFGQSQDQKTAEALLSGNTSNSSETSSPTGAEQKSDTAGTGTTPDSTAQAATANPAQATVPEEKKVIPFDREIVNLSIVGTYAQIVQSIKDLQHLDRVVHIQAWNLVTLNSDNQSVQTSSAVNLLEEGHQLLNLNMSFYIYTAAKYNLFSNELSAPVKELPNRTDPTMSDWKYDDILKFLSEHKSKK